MKTAHSKHSELGGPLYWATWVVIFTALYAITCLGMGTAAPAANRSPSEAHGDSYVDAPR